MVPFVILPTLQLQIGLGDGRKLQGLRVGHVGQTVVLDGVVIDEFLDEEGEFLDEEGEFLDEEGEFLDEEGAAREGAAREGEGTPSSTKFV